MNAARLQLAEEQRRADAKVKLRDQKLRSIPEIVIQARDHLRNGQFREGLEINEELLLEKIEDPKLLEVKSDLLDNDGKWNQAYQTLLLRLKQTPKKGYLFFAAGNLALNLNGPKEALTHFETAANFDPENIGYQIAFANVCFKSGRIDQGSAAFNKLIAPNAEYAGIIMRTVCATPGKWMMALAFSALRLKYSPLTHGIILTWPCS